jgi:L-fuculose-phosphate aldolase
MRPEDLVMVDLQGKPVGSAMKPSVDTMNHVAIYRARPDVGAVLHTHSPYAAAFSTLHREIPPLITEAAGYLGGAVKVMEYLPPASPALADRLAVGLGADRAVLLPNHGVMAVGESPKKASTPQSRSKKAPQWRRSLCNSASHMKSLGVRWSA